MFSPFIFCVLCVAYATGLLMPMTKSDGTLDMSSLVGNIALLEQSIDNKVAHLNTELAETKAELAKVKITFQKELATTKSEVTHLKFQLVASQEKLTETKTKLDTAIDELTQVKCDQSTSHKDLSTTNNKLDDATEELRTVSQDLKIELAILKHQVSKDNTSGTPGLTSDVSLLKSDVSDLKNEVLQLRSDNRTKSRNNAPGGTIFTRWGRTSCPAESSIVYKGYTGGTWYGDMASAASILCLPDQPIYAEHSDAGHDGSQGSHIYGTEYEIHPDQYFRSLHENDMPCVVCESNSRSSVLMIPARNECYSGWALEYSGYLMGPSHHFASSEYICVDSDAEAIPGGRQNLNGQLMYHVEGRCGVLPCPPYHDNWELTCVVCSK